jgi:hypothetical protein
VVVRQPLQQCFDRCAAIAGASLLEECAEVGETSNLLAISVVSVVVDSTVDEVQKLTEGGNNGLAALQTAIAVDAREGLPGVDSGSGNAGDGADSESNEGKLELHDSFEFETNETNS